MSGQDEYNECILQHLKGAKLDVASHFIKQACDDNFQSQLTISSKRKEKNKCLLTNLVGVESLQAVMAIVDACDSKHD